MGVVTPNFCPNLTILDISKKHACVLFVPVRGFIQGLTSIFRSAAL